MRRDAAYQPTLPGFWRGSGVVIRQKSNVEALVEAIDTVCREGKVDPIYAARHVLTCLELAKPWHWQAYARIAGVPDPDQETISATLRTIRSRFE